MPSISGRGTPGATTIIARNLNWLPIGTSKQFSAGRELNGRAFAFVH
jgi:hypothetical protein